MRTGCNYPNRRRRRCCIKGRGFISTQFPFFLVERFIDRIPLSVDYTEYTATM
jgi:hypothetical protein